MNQIKTLKGSLKEFKSVYSIAAIAMLLALRVVLGSFANTTLPLFGNNVKISPSFIPIALAGAMFGPLPAAIVGALGDILSFILVPTGGSYFPGFTISGFITGFIYGCALYKNQITLPRVIISWFINMFAVETFLAAYWLFMLDGGTIPYSVRLYIRFISEAIKCVPEIFLIFALGKLTSRIKLK